MDLRLLRRPLGRAFAAGRRLSGPFAGSGAGPRRWARVLICIWALLASAFCVGALAVSVQAEPQEIALSRLTQVSLLGRDAAFSFRPEVNGVYGVYLFAPEGSAAWLSARLYRSDGRELAVGDAAEGAPCAVSARLTAGETYRLEVSGAGRATLEIARETLGRCFDAPIRLDESGSYAKLIARPGDSHWYVLRAEAGAPAMAGILPEEAGLHLSATLLSASGKTLARSDALDGGACALCSLLTEGEDYYLRVEAEDTETGAYRLQVLFQGDTPLPKALSLDVDELDFDAGGRHNLRVSFAPEGTTSAVIWRSSDADVAAVTTFGEVIAVAPGDAVITAYGYGGMKARCAVSVRGQPMTGVRFDAETLTLRAGESQKLDYSFTPAGAYTRDVTFAVEDEGIASVDAKGLLTALGEGVTRVTIRAKGGAFSASLEVEVRAAAPRYRALLVGEQIYLPEVNKNRTGAINTVQNLYDMLGTYEMDGQKYEATMLLDASAGETRAAIRSAFANAAPQDVSMFYITCHGYYMGGMS